jgi:DNA mismatch endonuclease (patch repair protein)
VVPATRPEFWADKRRETKKRDARNIRELKAAGWKVLVVWECQSKSNEDIYKFLVSKMPPRS